MKDCTHHLLLAPNHPGLLMWPSTGHTELIASSCPGRTAAADVPSKQQTIRVHASMLYEQRLQPRPSPNWRGMQRIISTIIDTHKGA
jgi:hypothetical protein